MNTYAIKTVVEYYFEVEAENERQAEELGWRYEDYAFGGEVYSIDVDFMSSDEDEEEDED